MSILSVQIVKESILSMKKRKDSKFSSKPATSAVADYRGECERLRSELAQWEGHRREFQGVFDRFGSKAGFKHPLTTILLRNIVDVRTGKVVAGHLWFTLGKGFEQLNLQTDDIVMFWARVSKYLKGYKGRREDVDKPLELDYRLSFPTKLRKVAAKATPIQWYEGGDIRVAVSKRRRIE